MIRFFCDHIKNPSVSLCEVETGLVGPRFYLIEWMLNLRGSRLFIAQSAPSAQKNEPPFQVLLEKERVFWPHLNVYRSNYRNQQTLALVAIVRYERDREQFQVLYNTSEHLLAPIGLIRMKPGSDPFTPKIWK